jgi:Effector-associated domain 1/Trypsin-like peptidase domain
MALTGDMADKLAAALRDAFRTRVDLARMLWYKVGRNLDDYAGTGGLNSGVFELIRDADAYGWLAELLDGAIRQNPRNPPLNEFYEQYHIALSAPARSQLQSIIKPKVPSFDFEPWVAWLIQTGRQVCLIRIQTRPIPKSGTGFLIGPNVVMTAYHVLKETVADAESPVPRIGPEAVSFTFDYVVLSDGLTINQGVSYKLSGSIRDWLLFASPGSRFDENIDEGGQLPSQNELDCVIVKLDGQFEQSRGWIPLDVADLDLRPHDPLMILHHPAKSPLRFAIDSDSVTGVNENGTRVQYRLNTVGGSSGAPCFDSGQTLVAIHQRGDEVQQKANQGVPVATISANLKAAGLNFHYEQ